MRVLESLARFCAIAAGLLLTAITVMTCLSVIGRNTTGQTLVGDFELTGVAAGAAIALFLPWCQIKRGNIIVDFFTSKAKPSTVVWMDRTGAMMLALVMGLMTWRTSIGGLNAFATQSGTMMLGFPEWVVYACMVPPLALTTLIGLWQSVFGFESEPAA